MGYMNEFPHSRMFDSDLREILEMYNTVKGLPSDWNTFRETMSADWIELKNFVNTFFRELNVQNEINNKIDALVADGTMDVVIRPIFEGYNAEMKLLKARVDNLAKLEEGSTTGDAELADGKVDYTGYEHINIGEHIREVTSQLSSEIVEVKNDITDIVGYSLEYPLTWIENEYVNGGTGEIVLYEGWKRTDYTEIVNDKLYISTTQPNDNEYNAFYDENKKYLSRMYVTGGSNKADMYIPPNAKYFIMSCATDTIMQSYPSVNTLDKNSKEIEKLSNTVKLMPSYYDTYMSEKNKKVNWHMDAISNCVSFIFFTDQHLYSNAKKSGYLMQDIIDNTGVRDVINGGDVISAYGNETQIIDDCEKYRQYWGGLHPYYVRGNHDIYVKETDLGADGILKSNEMVINRFMRPFHDDMVIESGKTYYYFDRPHNKVRFICIDTTENMTAHIVDGVWLPDFEHSISQEQVKWFIDLLKETPQDYKIVLCNHIPITSKIKWGSDFTYIFGDIVEAFNTKSTINKTDKYGLTANADFSATNGKIILSICGHGHTDDTYTSPSGCVYYEVNCDAYLNNGDSEYAREVGTVTEQAFDVVIINADNGDIHTVRYGAGIDKTLVKH